MKWSLSPTIRSIIMSKDFAKRLDELGQSVEALCNEAPDTLKGFFAMHDASVAPGALDTKTKELIALSVGIAVHCEGCIAYHVHDALKAGASHQEIIETIGVAVMMGGGPALMYGCDAYQALQQFERQKAA